MVNLTKANKEISHLRKFIIEFNEMLKSNLYCDGGRVYCFLNTEETEITIHVLNDAVTIDITPYNEYGVMLEINKAIEELY